MTNNFHTIILEAYSEGTREKLFAKFRSEADSNITDDSIYKLISGFEQIKNSPKVAEKDLFKYNIDSLTKTIMDNAPKPFKKKEDESVRNSRLVYDNNNLKIYRAETYRACVEYGTGYNFCISARSEMGVKRFDEYTKNSDFIPYFVFDNSRSKEKSGDAFVDPLHLIVIIPMAANDNTVTYSIADANNAENVEYDWNDLIKIQPKLKGLESIFLKDGQVNMSGGNSEPQTLMLSLFESVFNGKPEAQLTQDIKSKLLSNLNNLPIIRYSIRYGTVDRRTISIYMFELPEEQTKLFLSKCAKLYSDSDKISISYRDFASMPKGRSYSLISTRKIDRSELKPESKDIMEELKTKLS